MALYHLTVSQIRRSAGQSAIAAAAYRAGECLYSDYYGEYSDYTRKGGVICSEILLPPHAPPITLFFSDSIFRMMNIDPEILHETCMYLMIVGGFSIVQGLYLNFAAILRSHTRLKEVMVVSIIMNVLNIIGNAILINGLFGFPRLGVVGAAVSTVISKTIGLLLIYIGELPECAMETCSPVAGEIFQSS